MTNQSSPAAGRAAAAQQKRRPWLAAVMVALVLVAGATAAITRGAGIEQPSSPPPLVALTSQTPAPPVGIKNFGRVNENYYRGAQPDAAGFAELKKLGVKTVIDLREDRKRDAPEWVRKAGMEYVNIPLKASRPATEEETKRFLQLVNDPANWPVYVHCKGGRHRTGALTAIYRITHDNWSADLAFKEMLDYDFDNGGLFSTGESRKRQKQFVYDFYEQHTAARGTEAQPMQPQTAPTQH